jgi:hypothetical protein
VVDTLHNYNSVDQEAFDKDN